MAKGHKTGGRTRGTPNKLTAAFKEAVLLAYDSIGGDAAFATWAQKNQTDFYKIAARLLPQEMRHAAEGGRIEVVISNFSEPTAT